MVMSAAGIARPPSGRGGRGAPKRIRTAAPTLFYRAAVQATGVQRLTQEANVSKRIFYQHFPSNTDLVEEYLRGIYEAGTTLGERAIKTETGTPRHRLLAIFDGTPVDRVRGCPFHNAAVESAGRCPASTTSWPQARIQSGSSSQPGKPALTTRRAATTQAEV
jgi:AcrR family transcriptional regulator